MRCMENSVKKFTVTYKNQAEKKKDAKRKKKKDAKRKKKKEKEKKEKKEAKRKKKKKILKNGNEI